VPIPWPALALGVIAAVIALEWHGFARPHHVRESRRDHGLCLNCGYDPRGNPTDICPECGTIAAPSSPSPKPA
jgi:hypothetical protein